VGIEEWFAGVMMDQAGAYSASLILYPAPGVLLMRSACFDWQKFYPFRKVLC